MSPVTDDLDRTLRVGFVGLGSQGAPMARRIVDAGHPTTLWARRPDALAAFADTAAAVAAGPAELGAASDVLCVCVVDDAGVDAVLRGPQGALAQMPAGGVVVVHSTTSPQTCRRLQEDFPLLSVLDAPVSGGGARAADGTLLVMVGGDAEVLARVRPVLDAFADPVVHLGGLGAGQEAKLLNNAVFAAQLGIAADAFDLARARGLDLAGLARVLQDGSGRSYAADVLGYVDHRLSAMGEAAGPLLAKDVGLLADLVAPQVPHLVQAADVALTALGRPRPGR